MAQRNKATRIRGNADDDLAYELDREIGASVVSANSPHILFLNFRLTISRYSAAQEIKEDYSKP